MLVSQSNIRLPPGAAPDLTSRITRSNDQYWGGGAFADVYRCQFTGDDSVREVAVKAFRLFPENDNDNNDSNKIAKMIRRELEIWRRLSHPNIVPLLGIAYGFGRQGSIALVSPWMFNGTIGSLISNHDANLTIAHRLQLLLDISNGLHHLHMFPMIHGDLSPNNVLIDHNYNACLTDFGLTSFIGEVTASMASLQVSSNRPGTVRWSAPEHFLVDTTTPFTTQSDIYSFGNMAFLVFTGRKPWSEIQHDAAVMFRLSQGHKPGRPELRPIEDDHWEFIESCWSSVNERPGSSDVASRIQQFLASLPSPIPLHDVLVEQGRRPTTLPSENDHAAAHPGVPRKGSDCESAATPIISTDNEPHQYSPMGVEGSFTIPQPAVVDAPNGIQTRLQPPPSESWASGSGAAATDPSNGVAPCDDKDGHYIIVPDDIIYNRYRTVRLLGKGTFAKVVEAVDVQTQNRVAIKIIRAIPKYRDASRIEIRVLQKLKEVDPANVHKCIHLLHWFDHRNHICLVSELLGMSVYDFLKENEFAPFPRNHIQSFARQLFGSVSFLHEHHLVCTGLKPEDILLVHNDYRIAVVPFPGKRNAPPGTRTKRILQSTEIRLADFSSAIFEEEYHSTVVSTRHYRAPEIILGLGWSYPCDAYSLGCILVEFYTGVALYQTHDDLEHLAMMEAVMGKMPDLFARAGARSKPEFFKEGSQLDWPKPGTSRQSKRYVRATKPIMEVIPPHDQINEHFLDIVRRLLAFDPAQRITVQEALHHPYFSIDVPDEL